MRKECCFGWTVKIVSISLCVGIKLNKSATLFTWYELQHANIVHANLIRYDLFTSEPYLVRAYYIMNFSNYERLPIRNLSGTSFRMLNFAYEPFPVSYTNILRNELLCANLIHTNFFLYKRYTYEYFLMQTFSFTI